MVDAPRLSQQLCFALYAASNAVVRAYRPLLARIGLTYPQYLALMVLWEDDDIPVQQLADRLEQGSQGLSPVLRRLEQAGLVVRRVDTADRRVVRVGLTEEGRRLAPLATSVQMDVVCQTGLDPAGYDRLRSTLRDLTRTTGGAAGHPHEPVSTATSGSESPSPAGDDLSSTDWSAFLASDSVAAYETGNNGTVTAASPKAAQMLRLAPEQLLGCNAHATLHHTDRRGVELPAESCPIRSGTVDRRLTRAAEDTFWRGDGTPLPVWWIAMPGYDPVTNEQRTVVLFDHLGKNDRLEQAQRSDADTRLLVLGRLSELLGINDVEEGLRQVAALGASTLADWCVIDRLDEGHVTRAAIADRVNSQSDLDQRLRSMPPLTSHSSGSLGRVLRGRDSVAIDLLVNDEPFPNLSSDALDQEQAALFSDLGASHAFVVPLRARDQVLGAMTWVRQDPNNPFTDTDVLLATVFGFRVGLWLDNARLYLQQKRISETLQRNLLTEVPEPDHLHVVARYAAASEGVEVGGDWYDAHLTPEGHLAVTIGDVTGHDSEAAARMSQLRSMLRFALLDDPAHPEAALTRVDTAMPVLAITGQASAVVAVIEQGDAQRPTSRRTVTWTNAGHLPPVLISPGGQPRLLEASPDLLLGVRSATPRHAHQVTVEPGSTLLLYTDGLIERRNETIDRGLDRLIATAQGVSHLPPEDICDTLLAQLAPEEHRSDDIALIAIHFDDRDRTRPRDAGTERLSLAAY